MRTLEQTPMLVLGASGLNSSVAVAAAALVVVLTIVLVFVMVLRSNGSAKRTSGGVGYDAQQGPYGQPRNEQEAGWPRQATPGWPPAGEFGNGQMPAGAGHAPAGWGPAGDYGQPGAPAPGSQGGARWGAPAAPWDDPQATPAAGAWGAPQAQPNPWSQNPQAGWNPAAAPGSRPIPSSGPSWEGPAGGAVDPRGAWNQTPAAQPQSPWEQQAGAGWAAPQPGPSTTPAQGGPAGPWSQQPGQAGPDWGAAPGAQPWAGGAPQPGSFGDGIFADGDKTRVVRPPAGRRTPVLVVRHGKEPGRMFEVHKERLTIGRSRESDIFLDDLAVSRTHTSLSIDESGRYVLRDENSANHTWVNGARVSEHVLTEGDEIQIGQTVLAFVRQ